MKPNCERISRKAERIQWTGENTVAVMGMLARGGLIGESFHNGEHILIYKNGGMLTSICHGTWVFEREDGEICFHDDETHKSKYQPINDELERLRAFAREIVCRDRGNAIGTYTIDLISNRHGVTPESLKAPK